ncbi:metallophosphoesterase family protein [Alteraurantiacibacter aquimixticola]|uniref:Metallophosphoesterase n=1 Tax=Alteraurantiacibacter aquimixticola TaxID=2489173 RepID=A0A4T3EX83_9SPHN|nr:metallophosphoesterase [Alteraurantiacibacter aquimixticola]TIX49123.1 metallophosphoesterase [Alteraurantiacibacter aquimixticola]
MANKLTLFHLSDIHFGIEDNRALDWVRQEILARKPDAVAITGDLTMRARRHEFAAAEKWIRSLPVPVTIEPGNHDLPGYHLPQRYLNPLARFEAFRDLVERRLQVDGLALVPLNTNVPAQPRLNWSKGWITKDALDDCLAQIDSLPSTARVLVTAHHPLREAGTHGTALTRNGSHALAELAQRNVLGVLSGHVHDAFDIMEATPNGPVRMIGAGTLSHRIRSTPASFNELHWNGEELSVRVRNLEGVASREMMIDEVPEDAMPPREPGEPVAPVGHVPRTDPPVD